MNVAAKSDPDPRLLRESVARDSGRVECLGMSFESDEARRRYFLKHMKETPPGVRRRPDLPGDKNEEPHADDLRVLNRVAGLPLPPEVPTNAFSIVPRCRRPQQLVAWLPPAAASVWAPRRALDIFCDA